MRIVICGPPKCGNHWIQSILVNIYGLTGYDRVMSIDKLADQPNNSISIQHFHPSDELFYKMPDTKFVSIIRDPYDVFVSAYFYANNFPDSIEYTDGGSKLVDVPISHPNVIDWLANNFGGILNLALDWINSKRSCIIRYEDMHTDIINVVKTVTDYINPIDEKIIYDAVNWVTPERMRSHSEAMRKHIRSAIVGDWRNHLSRDHLEIFKNVLSHLILELGYSVQP